MVQILQRLQAHYESREMPFGKVYQWHPAAVALEGDAGRMPLVDSSEGHFAALVVCFGAFEDLHHRLLALSPAVLWQGVPARRHFSRVGS